MTNQIRLKMKDEARRLSEVSLPKSLSFIAITWSMIILGTLLPVLVTYCLTGSGWVLSQLFASNDPGRDRVDRSEPSGFVLDYRCPTARIGNSDA